METSDVSSKQYKIPGRRVILMALAAFVCVVVLHYMGTLSTSPEMIEAPMKHEETTEIPKDMDGEGEESTAKPSAKYCYVAMITSQTYVMSVAVMMHSLKLQNPKYPIILFVTDTLINELPDEFKILTDEIRIIEPFHISKEFKNTNIRKPKASFEHRLGKLKLFKIMKGYSKVCFIDADMVVIKNIDDIFTYPTPAAHRDYWTPKDKEGCNTGFFLFEPSEKVYDHLEKVVNEHFVRELNLSKCCDQPVLNYAFVTRNDSLKWNLLPWGYVVDGRNVNYLYKEKWLADTKVWHFPGNKPWFISGGRRRIQWVQWFRAYDMLIEKYPDLLKNERFFSDEKLFEPKPTTDMNVTWNPHPQENLPVTFKEYYDDIRLKIHIPDDYQMYNHTKKKP